MAPAALALLIQLGNPGVSVPPVGPAVPATPIGRSCLFDGRSGLPASPGALVSDLLASQVVYAGERHDSPAHHRAQRQLLETMLGADPRAAAAFEMLYTTQQPALNAYLSGALDAPGFQAAVDWPKTWGFPFRLYEPLFETLRQTSRSGAALNVPKEIITKVRKLGLASLTPEERAFVPEGFQLPSDPAYLEMLKEWYQAHGYPPNDAVLLGQFIDAQTLWNEGMAAALARFVASRPGAPVLVVAGAYHTYAAGVPAGVARRVPGVRQLSVVLLERDACPAQLDPQDLALSADYYWVP
ncbi:MAG: ChaN family lipoprotein [Elusimicrobia bacterium]|nr:ChaN family lipoprotein [Elusimicrobiota bacterium]